MSEEKQIFEENFSQIALNLSSINSEFRKTALVELKKILQFVSPLYFVKLSAAVFYYYWYSDGPDQQAIDRKEIISMVDFLPEQLRMNYIEVFLDSLTELWQTIDHIRIEKYLLLLKELFLSIYSKLFKSDNWRQILVKWNVYFSNTVIYDQKCILIRYWHRPRVDLRLSFNLRGC